MTYNPVMTMHAHESQTEKHARLAEQLLEDAKRDLAAGDLVQGSEKLWGAASQAIKSYCASRNLPHAKYQHRRRAVIDLAEQSNNPFLRATFGIAESCHANFYNDWMEQEHLDTYLPDLEELVRLVLEARAR